MGEARRRKLAPILAGVATWEREIMLERQREGIAKAKAEGKYKGRPQGKRTIEFYSPTGPAFGRHSSNEQGSLRLVRSYPT
jgi:DNA invertase Pin-like site-specific DNA recombinase